MSYPVFITCRDRVQCLRALVARLESMRDVGPIVLVDNDSAWPPLLDYLAATPHEVIRVGRNGGHRVVWDLDLRPDLRSAGPFVVTDPDVVPEDGCPDDALSHLASLLAERPNLVKVGLGLRIDDLPTGQARADDVRDWESQFWDVELAAGVFEAAVDTTFALYRAGAGPDIVPALRTGGPYLARHLPWYDNPEQPDAEEVFYRARARVDSTSWHLSELEPLLAAALARRRRLLRQQPDHPLLDAWAAESAAHDLGFAELAAALVRMAAPGVVLETGIGEGYVTRRIAAAAGEAAHLCSEGGTDLRAALAATTFFASPQRPLGPAPTDADLARADVSVLASTEVRAELERWRAHARPGALVLAQLDPAGVADALDLPGTALDGAFLARHPGG